MLSATGTYLIAAA